MLLYNNVTGTVFFLRHMRPAALNSYVRNCAMADAERRTTHRCLPKGNAGAHFSTAAANLHGRRSGQICLGPMVFFVTGRSAWTYIDTPVLSAFNCSFAGTGISRNRGWYVGGGDPATPIAGDDRKVGATSTWLWCARASPSFGSKIIFSGHSIEPRVTAPGLLCFRNSRCNKRRSIAAEHLNIKVANLLSQSVTIEPQKICGTNLIAACRCQGSCQQWILDLTQDAMIQPDWGQPVLKS
jgi:hypothetical protein